MLPKRQNFRILPVVGVVCQVGTFILQAIQLIVG